MLDVTLFTAAVAVAAAHGIINLLSAEAFRSKTIDRLSGTALGLPLTAACATLLFHERWRLLLILNGVCYAITAPFMTSKPLQTWTIPCSFDGYRAMPSPPAARPRTRMQKAPGLSRRRAEGAGREQPAALQRRHRGRRRAGNTRPSTDERGSPPPDGGCSIQFLESAQPGRFDTAPMKTIWRRIALGACWSEEQGDHPGTPLLALFIFMGALAGHDRGPWGWAIGAGVMLCGMGPVWVYGCYRMGTELEAWRREARETTSEQLTAATDEGPPDPQEPPQTRRNTRKTP